MDNEFLGTLAASLIFVAGFVCGCTAAEAREVMGFTARAAVPAPRTAQNFLRLSDLDVMFLLINRLRNSNIKINTE
jgi:hypothetical protein